VNTLNKIFRNSELSLPRNILIYARHSLPEENGKTARIFADFTFGVSFN
jgi:hypothetical protein